MSKPESCGPGRAPMPAVRVNAFFHHLGRLLKFLLKPQTAGAVLNSRTVSAILCSGKSFVGSNVGSIMSADVASRTARSMRPGAAGLSTLLVLGLTLASLPAFSQGAMAPGGGAMAPQPRVAPAPQAPAVAPQAPVVVAPQAPVVVAPIPFANQPGPTAGPQKIINNSEVDVATVEAQYLKVTGTVTTAAGARALKADAKGTLPLGVLQPGTHRVAINVKELLTPQRTPGSAGPAPREPAGILVGLLLPAVQKVGEAPTTVTVERRFPRSFFANSAETRIEITVPQGGGNAKVNWGDKSPAVDVVQDGSATRLRISADVSTIRVQNY